MKLIFRCMLLAMILVSFSACAEFSEVFGGKAQSSQSPRTVASKGPKLKPGEKLHVVREGETLEKISKRYRVTPQEIIGANDLEDAQNLEVGQKLVIPKRGKQNKVKPASKHRNIEEKTISEPTEFSKEDTAPRAMLVWPIEKGRLTSGQGIRKKRDHDGVDLFAPTGTPVKAAATGDVIFAGRMSGYGNLVVMRHAGNYFTAYAHLSEIKVSKGQRMKQGSLIGLVGRTGRASGPHLHFEVRYKTRAEDPLKYLPEMGEIKDERKLNKSLNR